MDMPCRGSTAGRQDFLKVKINIYIYIYKDHIYKKNHYIYIYISDDQEKETFDSLLPRKETTR